MIIYIEKYCYVCKEYIMSSILQLVWLQGIFRRPRLNLLDLDSVSYHSAIHHITISRYFYLVELTWRAALFLKLDISP